MLLFGTFTKLEVFRKFEMSSSVLKFFYKRQLYMQGVTLKRPCFTINNLNTDTRRFHSATETKLQSSLFTVKYRQSVLM